MNFDRVLKKRMEILQDSTNKIKLMNDIPGVAKTWTALEYCLNTNKNNTIFFENHKLIFDFSNDLINPTKFNLKNQYNIVNGFYGKFKKLTDMERMGKFTQEYPCSLCVDDIMFNCVRMGYAPTNFCNSFCIYNKVCEYKQHIQTNFAEAINVQNNKDSNVMNLMTKSHVHTNLRHDMFDAFKDINIIMDENFFSLLYDQLDLSIYNLQKYKNTILNIMSYDSSLHNIWIDYSSIVNRFIDFIKGFKTLKPKLKIKRLYKEIELFLDSYTIKDIENWNYIMSITAINNIDKINLKTVNMTISFLKIFEYIYKCNKNNTNYTDSLVLNNKDNLFSFIINKKDDIKQLIDDSKKFIITSSLIDKELFETLFPNYINDYDIIHDSNLKPKFKEVWRYTRGVYPKYVLWKKNKPTTSFNNLIKTTADILYKHKKDKILIIAFKHFVANPITKKNYIHDLLELKVDNFKDCDIVYDYWYALEGLNRYKDVDIQIQFGSPGVPGEYTKSLSYALHIDESFVNKVMIYGEQLEAAERLRSYLQPDSKIIYQLSSLINGYYHNYIDFSNILEKKFSHLLDFITRKGFCTEDTIVNDYFKNKKSKKSINYLLNKLKNQNLIYKKRIKDPITKKSKNIWKCI